MEIKIQNRIDICTKLFHHNETALNFGNDHKSNTGTMLELRTYYCLLVNMKKNAQGIKKALCVKFT